MKDDDPDALEAVLRYIYTTSYIPSKKNAQEWLFHLKVSVTAEKYLLPELNKWAYKEFERLIWKLTDAEDVFTALQILSDYAEQSDAVKKLRLDLREKHILSLLKLPAFRQILNEDRTLMWKYLDYFSNLQEKELAQCDKCGRMELCNFGTANSVNCRSTEDCRKINSRMKAINKSCFVRAE